MLRLLAKLAMSLVSGLIGLIGYFVIQLWAARWMTAQPDVTHNVADVARSGYLHGLGPMVGLMLVIAGLNVWIVVSTKRGQVGRLGGLVRIMASIVVIGAMFALGVSVFRAFA